MIAFRYDHTQLSPLDLHEVGIRGTRELEKVIEGYSFGSREIYNGIDLYIFVGSTRGSKPVAVVFTTTPEIDIVTRAAVIPPVEEIVREFCRYCYPTKPK